MHPQKGYYSLIQFCPDASRAETVNLGVILFCPSTGFLKAKTSSNSRRAEKLVNPDKLARKALRQSLLAIEKRLVVDQESLRDIESLHRFVATRGNTLQLTSFRPVRVTDPAQNLSELFEELVEEMVSKSVNSRTMFPELDELFTRLSEEGRAELDYRIQLPVMEIDFKVPFAYQNGVLNLVKPQRFVDDDSQKALNLAIRGNLIQKHGLSNAIPSKLVVVSRFESKCEGDFISHVESLLTEYGVEHVKESGLEAFVKLVETEAHFQIQSS